MKYWHLKLRQENAVNHVLTECLLFPQAGWDLKACSQVKRRSDFGLGQWDILLEANQGWAGDRLPRPWVYHATSHLFSVSHLSFKNTFVHLWEQTNEEWNFGAAGSIPFQEYDTLVLCSKWQGLRGKLVDTSLYKSFCFSLWQLLQNSWELSS